LFAYEGRPNTYWEYAFKNLRKNRTRAVNYGNPDTNAPPRFATNPEKKFFAWPRQYQDAVVTETGTKIEFTSRPWDEIYAKLSALADDPSPFMTSRESFSHLRKSPSNIKKNDGSELEQQVHRILDLDPNYGNLPQYYGTYYTDGQNYRPQCQITTSDRTTAQLKYKHPYVFEESRYDTVGGLHRNSVDFGVYMDQSAGDRYADITTMKEIAYFLKKGEEQLGFQVTIVNSYAELYANYTASDLEQFDHIWDIVHGGLINFRDLGVGHASPVVIQKERLVFDMGASTGITYPVGSVYGKDGYVNWFNDPKNDNLEVPLPPGGAVQGAFKDHPFVKAQRPLTAIIPLEIKALYKSYLQSGGNIGFVNSPVTTNWTYPNIHPGLGRRRIIGINDFLMELGGGDIERFPAPWHMNKRDRDPGGGLDEIFGGAFGGSGIWSPSEWTGNIPARERKTIGTFLNTKNFPAPKWYLNSEFFIDNSKREVDLQSVSSWKTDKNGKLNLGTGTPVIVGASEQTDEIITSLNAKNFNYCCAAIWKRGSLSEAQEGSVFVINNLHWVIDVDLKYDTDYNSLWTKTQKDPLVQSYKENGRTKEYQWVQDAEKKIVDPLYRKFAVWGSRKRDEENFLNILQIFDQS